MSRARDLLGHAPPGDGRKRRFGQAFAIHWAAFGRPKHIASEQGIRSWFCGTVSLVYFGSISQRQAAPASDWSQHRRCSSHFRCGCQQNPPKTGQHDMRVFVPRLCSLCIVPVPCSLLGARDQFLARLREESVSLPRLSRATFTWVPIETAAGFSVGGIPSAKTRHTTRSN